MTNATIKTVLDNGLTVVMKEMHHAPVATFMVWYRVGSRNEKPGITGAAHWVEHMMFKGTPTIPTGEHDRTIAREGGRFNAFTWLDFTAYYETLPSDRIELGLHMEADRMTNALMHSDEIESERTVIISERNMYENQPLFHLREELSAAAFRVHPYHHETIGDAADLASMTRDDLYGFYRRHYAPNNAIAVAVGDFDSADILQKIKHYFGDLQPSQPPDPITRTEPAQKGERRITVKGPGNTAYLIVSYKAPAATDPDYYALAVLNSAFAGGGSLGFFGSSTTNKSSRLYKALVNTELAAGVSAGATPTIDPYLYSFTTVARPGRTLAEVETALDAEIARLTTEPITQAELDKAHKRARVEFIMSGESITNQAQLLGMSEVIAGDYTWYETALERVGAVTLADIERVRDRYLRPDQRTVGHYIPQNSSA